MLTPSELGGLCAMMPAFATDDAQDVSSRSTVDVDRLTYGVNRIIEDGANMIATTGSFGEAHTLVWSEYETLIRATVEAARQRVPVFIGITRLNTRDAIDCAQRIRDLGADGVLSAVPFYFPSTVQNAVQYYQDLADSVPDFPVMIYHNPTLHRIKIPVEAFEQICTRRNVVAMKDSHHTLEEFDRLIATINGRIAVFVYQSQLLDYYPKGASGCWSINAWMGPQPIVRLLDACRSGNWDLAGEICRAIPRPDPSRLGPEELQWRESTHKLAINAAGYCMAGPLRPPFRNIPPEVFENARTAAAEWRALVEKYSAAPTAA